MHEAIRQAIADLSALLDGADRDDAERIRALIERLRDFDAQARCSPEDIARLHIKFSR
jgi:hypothetical protein